MSMMQMLLGVGGEVEIMAATGGTITESGDWKMFSIDWPAGYTENGTALIDVDWDDNIYTDVDVHWMSETAQPYEVYDLSLIHI